MKGKGAAQHIIKMSTVLMHMYCSAKLGMLEYFIVELSQVISVMRITVV